MAATPSGDDETNREERSHAEIVVERTFPEDFLYRRRTKAGGDQENRSAELPTGHQDPEVSVRDHHFSLQVLGNLS